MRVCHRISATMIVLVILMCVTAGMASSAAYAYDVDFSIKPDKTEVEAGDTFNVDVVITTRKSGYVEFDFELSYDESMVLCETESYSQDGYTGDGTAEGIFTLKYKDPSTGENPQPTKKDEEYTVHIAFKAKSVTDTKSIEFKGKINKLSGVNSLDNYKVIALTPANLTTKTIKVQPSAGGDVSEAESQVVSEDSLGLGEVGSQPDDSFAQTVVPEKNNDTLKIALIIIGGLVVFVSGFAAGYMVCQKRKMKESAGHASRRNEPDDQMDFYPSSGNDYRREGIDIVAGVSQNRQGYPAAAQQGGSHNRPLPQNGSGNNNNAASYYSDRTYAGGQPVNMSQQTSQQPKYGTDFEGTYAQYANRQQQMQRTYTTASQQPQVQNVPRGSAFENTQYIRSGAGRAQPPQGSQGNSNSQSAPPPRANPNIGQQGSAFPAQPQQNQNNGRYPTGNNGNAYPGVPGQQQQRAPYQGGASSSQTQQGGTPYRPSSSGSGSLGGNGAYRPSGPGNTNYNPYSDYHKN